MYSLRAQFAILLLQAVSLIPHGEALCRIIDNADERRIVNVTSIPNRLFLCWLGPVKVCEGACVTSWQYNVHISDNDDPKSKCDFNVQQCMAEGTGTRRDVTVTTRRCVDAFNIHSGRQSVAENHTLVISIYEPRSCSCRSEQHMELGCGSIARYGDLVY